MKIALIGYGRIGIEIATIAAQKGIQVTDIFDINKPFVAGNYSFDVAIDFSTADCVRQNVLLATEMKKNIVIGTTGWYAHLPELRSIVGNSIACVWSSNFSIGMQIYYKVIADMTRRFNETALYDVFVSEQHHRNKIDSPSGTAISIGNIILENSTQKETLQTEQLHRAIQPTELHISATRGGSILGNHTVTFDSEFDSVELTHRVKDRRGFAEGALYAAGWSIGKSGFYEFGEVLSPL
ncbi:MAG: 4-hydroxy-tetrahydrodipicolinate reductase [Ignavibacteria bacterium]|jgi:4-hydroxy-tetrahydrodipicolinate reductase|nr:4-hydroxy-tetrahydrodipicolinate reductase [Ignavibacteria bacterium]